MLHRCCCCCSYTQSGGGTRAHITEYARVPSLYDTATLTRSTMVMIGVYGCNIRGGYCNTATLTASTTWRMGKHVLGPTGPGQSPPTCACECMTMKRAAACTCGLTAVLRMMSAQQLDTAASPSPPPHNTNAPATASRQGTLPATRSAAATRRSRTPRAAGRAQGRI